MLGFPSSRKTVVVCCQCRRSARNATKWLQDRSDGFFVLLMFVSVELSRGDLHPTLCVTLRNT